MSVAEAREERGAAAFCESRPVYVYGVVRRGALASLPRGGVAGASVEAIEHGGLAAVAGLLAGEPLRVRRRDLTAHLDVLAAAFAETTVVPCAFGTVLPSRDAVRDELLERRRGELEGLLERLDGRAQVNVKVSYDEEAELREVLAADPALRRASRRTRALGDAGYYERIRLGERVAAAVAAARESDSRHVLGRLSAVAEEVASEEPGPELVLRASFLVPRAGLRRFDEELEALARDGMPRLRFEAIGPLPPTAFVSLAGGGA